MRYLSTRTGPKEFYSFEDVLFSGYAPDNGLFMPEYFPKIKTEDLKIWRDYSFNEITYEILKFYISNEDIPHDKLKKLLNKAFSRFDIPEVLRLNFLYDGLNILELFHGPTYAFKDISLLCLGQFMQYFLSIQKRRIIILVGTSGDTGGAAIEAFRGLENIDLIVLLPKGLCTPVQELQMTTVQDKNIHVFQVEGNSDDLDIPIAACLRDPELNKHSQFQLCCINSINLVRVLVQIVHHTYAYLKLSSVDWDPYANPEKGHREALFTNMYDSKVDNLNLAGVTSTLITTGLNDKSDNNRGDGMYSSSHSIVKQKRRSFKASISSGENCVELAIPSGAGGNAAGACIAIQMGIPLKLTLCTNSNDVIARALQSGDFSALKPFKPTLSISMDILVPYNMERIFYIYSHCDPEKTKMLMEEFDKYKNVTVPPDILNEMQKDLKGYSCDDSKVRQTIIRCWQDNDYILCPHTAVAVSYYYDCKDKNAIKYPACVEATASYVKFPCSVETIKSYLKEHLEFKISEQRLNELDQEPLKIKELLTLPQKFELMALGNDWYAILKQKILNIASNYSS